MPTTESKGPLGYENLHQNCMPINIPRHTLKSQLITYANASSKIGSITMIQTVQTFLSLDLMLKT